VPRQPRDGAESRGITRRGLAPPGGGEGRGVGPTCPGRGRTRSPGAGHVGLTARRSPLTMGPSNSWVPVRSRSARGADPKQPTVISRLEEKRMAHNAATVHRCMGLLVAVPAILFGIAGHGGADEKPATGTNGVVLRRDGLANPQEELEKRIEAAPAGAMTGTGLAGAVGGLHVRVTADAAQEVLVPIPQLVGGQVPLCLFVRAEPADAATDFRLRTRDNGDVVLVVHLAGKKQEVRITWAAVVLLTDHGITPDRTSADPYRSRRPASSPGPIKSPRWRRPFGRSPASRLSSPPRSRITSRSRSGPNGRGRWTRSASWQAARTASARPTPTWRRP
jgi:hypothetical protein